MATIKKVTASGDLDVVVELSRGRLPVPAAVRRQDRHGRQPGRLREGRRLAGHEAGGLGSVRASPRTSRTTTRRWRRTRTSSLADEIKVDDVRALPAGRPGHRGRRGAVRPVQRRPHLRRPGRAGRGRPASRCRSSTRCSSACLDVHTGKAPFDDPAVVEALKFAIDREKIKEVANFGIGDVNYQPFPPGYVGYNPELERRLRVRPGEGEAAPRGRRLRPARSTAMFTSSGQRRGRGRADPGAAQGDRDRARRSRRSRRPSTPSSSTSSTPRR